MTVYRSEEGRRVLLSLYEEVLARIPGDVERRRIPTDVGSTHVLVAGPPDAPPVVVLQGGNFPNPVTLLWFSALFQHFRVYAPDLPGSPGYSVPRHLHTHPGALQRWHLQVLDALEIDQAPHMGASYGAGVVLEGALAAKDRISGMALVMPAGIARPRPWTLVRELALPMLRHRLRPTPDRLVAAVKALHTDPPDELILRVHAAIFRHLRLVRRMAAPADPAALARARIPSLIIAGERDPLFPADEIRKKVPGVLPDARVLVLEGTRHFPSAADREVVARALLAFAAGRRQQ
ncbi:MAG: alpha/beta fold hydrolase [Gemmatimonadales bacterium]|nr:MAG: alpha/beta fold hydrolase [Gemmatimonadales bacterium]